MINAIPASLARRRSIKYRYPTESWLLAATLLVLGAAFLTFKIFSFWGLITFFLFGVAVNYLFIRTFIEGFKRHSVQVTKTQFPEIHALVEECRQHVEIPRDTKVFVTYSPYMNAFAIGLGRPYAIMIFSALVDNLDRDELKYVIGHEMGHIHFGHTVWLTLIGQLGSQTYGLPFFGTLFRFCMLFWSRAAEMSADRAGLVACGKLDKVVSAEVKFGAGPLLARWADKEMLARQARETRISFLGSLVEIFGTHPTMTTRIRRIVDFGNSEIFRQLRPDVYWTNRERNPSTDNIVWQSAGTATAKPRRGIRRLVPKSNPKLAPSTLTERNIIPGGKGAPSDPLFEPDSSDSKDAEPVDDTSPTDDTPPDWSQEVGVQEMNVAAMRVNAEQANMWLKLGELFQINNQPEQATACLEQVRALLTGSNGSTTNHIPLSANNLGAISAGQQLIIPSKPKTGSACLKCGTVNPAQARYCYQCQASLRRVCLQCGTLLMANHSNCTACGQNQAQAISTLKAEAEAVRKTAKEPLPPRMLTWYEVVYGLIFMIDVAIVLAVLGWQNSNPYQQTETTLYIGGAILICLIGVIGGTIWARRRVWRYWRVFDEIEAATRRYNDIADILAQQNIALEPERLKPRDPWRWT